MSFPAIKKAHPALILAPMEGVTDAPMRALLTERGGFSFCVSEFLRVVNYLYPDHVFFEHIPELALGCKTPVGVPIQVQLLGGDEALMAESAVRATELGAKAIDINFGCPSKTVNRHDGGASLLQHPKRIRSITEAVRRSVDKSIPVSVKMRLGWERNEDIYHNAEQAVAGGASWLTIHARTKRQGYAPPAHWKYIGEVRDQLEIPIVANGDIWTVDDFRRCRDMTGCEHFMIGRGALADPQLPVEIAKLLNIETSKDLTPLHDMKDWEPLLARFSELHQPAYSLALLGRIKQWLRYAHSRERLPWFEDIKRTESVEDLFQVLRKQ